MPRSVEMGLHRFRWYMEKVALYFWLTPVTHLVSTIEFGSHGVSLTCCAPAEEASLGLPEVLVRSSSWTVFTSRQNHSPRSAHQRARSMLHWLSVLFHRPTCLNDRQHVVLQPEPYR